MDRKEVIRALGNIEKSYKEIVPDDSNEGKAIEWGIEVLREAQKMLKETLVTKKQIETQINETNHLIDGVNPHLERLGLPKFLPVKKMGYMWHVPIDNGNNECISGHWDDETLKLMKMFQLGFASAFSYMESNKQQ